VDGKGVLQPCFEVEGGKDVLIQQVFGATIIVPRFNGCHYFKEIGE
jgi:hypothetical protein